MRRPRAALYASGFMDMCTQLAIPQDILHGLACVVCLCKHDNMRLSCPCLVLLQPSARSTHMAAVVEAGSPGHSPPGNARQHPNPARVRSKATCQPESIHSTIIKYYETTVVCEEAYAQSDLTFDSGIVAPDILSRLSRDTIGGGSAGLRYSSHRSSVQVHQCCYLHVTSSQSMRALLCRHTTEPSVSGV